ncbi:hypothetical protein L6452_40356 [Arctium lappa]|uniref:Uncharacterized protein n=1 Tax=Arctium lappa TaxID=4217 RepID=A0ACB8XM95_ARCLA|nr:hypothetical protein L6452_40356 [Arctium lappa]
MSLPDTRMTQNLLEGYAFIRRYARVLAVIKIRNVEATFCKSRLLNVSICLFETSNAQVRFHVVMYM